MLCSCYTSGDITIVSSKVTWNPCTYIVEVFCINFVLKRLFGADSGPRKSPRKSFARLIHVHYTLSKNTTQRIMSASSGNTPVRNGKGMGGHYADINSPIASTPQRNRAPGSAHRSTGAPHTPGMSFFSTV